MVGWSLAASSVALRQMSRARRASPDTAATCQERGGEGVRGGERERGGDGERGERRNKVYIKWRLYMLQ